MHSLRAHVCPLQTDTNTIHVQDTDDRMTTNYAAPERLSSDPKSSTRTMEGDVYSFAIVLLELFSG